MQTELEPIGFVKSSYREPLHPYDPTFFAQLESEILLNKEHAPGLFSLKPGMRVDVLFFFDQISRETIAYTLHPKGDPENPLVGLWNSRSPRRPNPIGVTTVTILAIEENVLRVVGLDAFDKTPVLDIKRHKEN